jgi:hypothetical protein
MSTKKFQTNSKNSISTNFSLSYMDLHKIAKRATPEMFCKYKTALLLYIVFNDKVPQKEWFQLIINIYISL